MRDQIDDVDPLALEEQVCFALSVAARSVVAVYRPLLEPMGLTHPQYLVMLALWQHAPLSVRDLSRLLQLDPGTLSPLLKRLEVNGYVRRRRDPADERSLAVTLTASGQALRARAEEIPPAIVARLGLPVDDLRRLHSALTQVIAAANGATSPGAADSGAGDAAPPSPGGAAVDEPD
ncbi:MarR family winged helix-turn-helix transcriptional regulator [Micromonospora krabiensis]|uniref:Transcriptional regulator, MarR family n=1 Tax=Micromonospora krabiensis TaxID=307121 RepID=A0A1C3N8G9_9ACTN|nr:MarR family transcriptional regulator [Micromonospora krabiensis]SBV28881.1 transcriptional regulator, MarR family [Micromonospora krabiensis]